MPSLNRRDFLKAAGIGGAATATACAYDPRTPVENVLPYVVNPDDVLPGTASYYATACTQCASACGVIARQKEGRVVFVEGNPDHPEGPGLCARGHFGLVGAYAADRIDGPRLAGKGATWDDALAAVKAAVDGAQAAGKQVAWLGAYRTGSLARLLTDWAGAVKARRLHWEPLGVEAALAASRQAFNLDLVPSYDLAEARTIVTFGMDFMGTAFDAMHMVKGWSKAKDPASGGFVTRLVAMESRLGLSSSQADLWLAPTPGGEVGLALGLARAARDLNGYAGPGATLLDGVDVAAAARDGGVSEDKLREVAKWLTEGPSVVLPGGFGVDNPAALAVATLLVNQVCGNVGRTVTFGRGGTLGQVDRYADVKLLLDDARQGKVGVLFLDGANPVFNCAGDDGAKEALAAIDTIVQFADEADDSTTDKTILLPTGSSLESWGDHAVHAGVHVLQQPGMNPLKDSRSVGDVVFAMARAIVPSAAADDGVTHPVHEAASWPDFVKRRWERELYTPTADHATFASFWRACLERGGYFPGAAEPEAAFALAALPEVQRVAGGDGLALVVFPSPNLGDGRHANIPWAQELADPISTYAWTTWAEIHPDTVKKLGLAEGDFVSIAAETGTIKVGFFGSPAVAAGTVAVMLGNGHEGMGRYARGRGANAMKLVKSASDAASGAMVVSGRARVSAAGPGADTFALCGSMHQDGRPVANNVDAVEAAANQDGEAGSLVRLHELPMDERLVAAGINDMYPEPQHPTYRLAMVIDTNVCNGCMACAAACALENNTPFVGPVQVRKGRGMSWIRMDRFFEGEGEHPDIRYLPAICQQCSHAPCEGV
jgi:molybdopterin-containing oxidoreductase family iron-sulfur binding subunit